MSSLVAEKMGLGIARKSLLPEDEFFKSKLSFSDDQVASLQIKVNNFQNYQQSQIIHETLDNVKKRISEILTESDCAGEIVPFETLRSTTRWGGSVAPGAQGAGALDPEMKSATKENLQDIVKVFEKTTQLRCQLLSEILSWFALPDISGGNDMAALFDKKMLQCEKDETKSFQEVVITLQNTADAFKKLKSIGDSVFESDSAEAVSPKSSRLHGKTKAHLKDNLRRASKECDSATPVLRAEAMKNLFLPMKIPSDMETLMANPDETDEGDQKLLLEISKNWQEVGKEIRDILISVHELKILKRTTKLSVRRALYLLKMIISLLGMRTNETKLKEGELLKLRMDMTGATNKVEHLMREIRAWKEKMNAAQTRNSTLMKERRALEINLERTTESLNKKDETISDLHNRLTETMLKMKKDIRVEEEKVTEDKGKFKKLKDVSKKQNYRIDQLEKELKSIIKKQSELVGKEKMAAMEAEERAKHYEDSLREAKKKIKISQYVAEEYESDLKKKTEDLVQKDKQLSKALTELKEKEELVATILSATKVPEEQKTSGMTRKGSIKSPKTRRESKHVRRSITSASSTKRMSRRSTSADGFDEEEDNESRSSDSTRKGSESPNLTSSSNMSSRLVQSFLGSITERQEGDMEDHMTREEMEASLFSEESSQPTGSEKPLFESSTQDLWKADPSLEVELFQHGDLSSAQEQVDEESQRTEMSEALELEFMTSDQKVPSMDSKELQELSAEEEIKREDKAKSFDEIIQTDTLSREMQTEDVTEGDTPSSEVAPTSQASAETAQLNVPPTTPSQKRHSVSIVSERKKSVDITTSPEYKRVVAELWKIDKEKNELQANLDELTNEYQSLTGRFQEDIKALKRKQREKIAILEESFKQDIGSVYSEFLLVQGMMINFKKNLATLFEKNKMTSAAKLSKVSYNYTSSSNPVSYLEGVKQVNYRLEVGFEALYESIAVGIELNQLVQQSLRRRSEEVLGQETAHHLKVLAEKAELIDSLQTQANDAKANLENLYQKYEIETWESGKREKKLQETIQEKDREIARLLQYEAEAMQERDKKANQVDRDSLMRSNDVLENVLKDAKGANRRLKKHLVETVERLANEKKERLRLENLLYLQQNNAGFSVGDHGITTTRMKQRKSLAPESNKPPADVKRKASLQQDFGNTPMQLKISPSLKSVAKLDDGRYPKEEQSKPKGPRTRTGRCVTTLRKVIEGNDEYVQANLDPEVLDKSVKVVKKWSSFVAEGFAQIVGKYLKFRRLRDLADVYRKKVLALMAPPSEVLQLFSDTTFYADNVQKHSEDKQYIMEQLIRCREIYWHLQIQIAKFFEEEPDEAQARDAMINQRKEVEKVFQTIANTMVGLKKKGVTLYAKTKSSTAEHTGAMEAPMVTNIALSPKPSTIQTGLEVLDKPPGTADTMSVFIERKLQAEARAKQGLLAREVTSSNVGFTPRSPSLGFIKTKEKEAVKLPPQIKLDPTLAVSENGRESEFLDLDDSLTLGVKVSKIPIKVEVLRDRQEKRQKKEEPVTILDRNIPRKPHKISPIPLIVALTEDGDLTEPSPEHPRQTMYLGRQSIFSRSNTSHHSLLRRSQHHMYHQLHKDVGLTPDPETALKKSEVAFSPSRNGWGLVAKQPSGCIQDLPHVTEIEVRQDLREIRKTLQNSMRKHSTLTGKVLARSPPLSPSKDNSLTPEAQQKLKQRRQTTRYLGLDGNNDSEAFRINTASLIARARAADNQNEKDPDIIQYDFSNEDPTQDAISPISSMWSRGPQSRPSTAESSNKSGETWENAGNRQNEQIRTEEKDLVFKDLNSSITRVWDSTSSKTRRSSSAHTYQDAQNFGRSSENKTDGLYRRNSFL